MEKALKNELKILMNIFSSSFINKENELILVPAINLFFNIDNIETVEDLKVKVVSYCVRSTIRSKSEYWVKKIRVMFLSYLEIEFTKEDLELIYNKVGNGINMKLCREFVKSEFEINILDEELESKK